MLGNDMHNRLSPLSKLIAGRTIIELDMPIICSGFWIKNLQKWTYLLFLIEMFVVTYSTALRNIKQIKQPI